MNRATRLRTLIVAVTCAAALPAPAALAAPGRSLYPKQRQRLHRSFAPPAGKVRVAFLDADATLRVTRSGAPSPNKPGDQLLLPMCGPRIAKLVAQGYLIAVVSNQNGVEQGYLTEDDANRALRKTCNLVSKQPGCAIHYYDFAARRDENRKPGPGMADQLALTVKQKLGRDIDWERSLMIGDAGWTASEQQPGGRAGEDFSSSDRGFAECLRAKHGCSARGMAYHHPRDFFGWAALGVRNFHSAADVAAFCKAHPEQR